MGVLAAVLHSNLKPNPNPCSNSNSNFIPNSALTLILTLGLRILIFVMESTVVLRELNLDLRVLIVSLRILILYEEGLRELILVLTLK